MTHPRIDRRSLLAAGAALAGAPLWPRITLGAESLIAAMFGGTWSEVHRTILKPCFEKDSGASVSQAAMLATEQISKLTAAAGGQPPFDVAMMDEGPALQAIERGLLAEYDASLSPNFGELLPKFQDPWGPSVSMQCIGLAYNPRTVKEPPTSWEDLWDPKYEGRVGITSLASTLGTAFLVEISRLNGGHEGDMGPAFAKLQTLLPNLGAVSANFGAHAALFQQEVVDVGVQNFNFVETLKGKGVSIEWVKPDTGAPAWKTTMHVVRNAAQPGLAHTYINCHLKADVQTAMGAAPYNVIPTNANVPLSGQVKEKVAATHDELDKLIFYDWSKINEGRDEWSKQFNRQIRV
ncbi:MAG: extracellular solute-binding protein [Gammaproteobacteria bacterium]